MEHKKPEQHKKEHMAPTGSCSTGGGMGKTGSCGSSTEAKKHEHTGSCGTGGKSDKGSCH